MSKLTVESLYGGGAVERFHGELEKAIANIVDPNTPAKKPRKVKLEMIIKPNEHRNMAEVLVTTSCSLQSPQPLETSIYIGADPRTGEIGASEKSARRKWYPGKTRNSTPSPEQWKPGGKFLS